MAARKTTTRKPAKRDVEAEVTARIVEALEAGTVPWRKPWTAAGLLPTSVATGKPYRGINPLLLWLTAEREGYTSPFWLTYKQATERGGQVRKGEKGTGIVFWRRWEVEDKETGEAKSVFILRFFTVFNVEQVDDLVLPPRFTVPDIADIEFDIADAEAIWSGYVDGPQLDHKVTDTAAYSPDLDVIRLPKQGQFESAEAYYGTLFHESVHSTGHKDRLNRFEKNGEPQHFGTERYAKEELVAEMGAAMLRSMAGIATDDSTEQTAAYVKSWLEALKNDKALVIKAAAQAQRAVDRIVGTAFEVEADNTAEQAENGEAA